MSMKKYLILEDNTIKAFGLNEVHVKNRVGIKNKIVEYERRAVPQFDKRLYSAREAEPILQGNKYVQQWQTFELPLNTAKRNMVDDLGKQTAEYIYSYYSDTKQKSDVSDKEYWGAWLINHFPSDYTMDGIYTLMFNSALKIIEGTSDFTTELTSLKTVTTFADATEEAKYAIALEQLLKVAIRQGWVQACKAEYAMRCTEVQAATTIADLEAVNLAFMEYPL